MDGIILLDVILAATGNVLVVGDTENAPQQIPPCPNHRANVESSRR
jgi:hypothetical protein